MMHNPPHPGEVLYGLYIEPAKLTISQVAKALNMPRSALSQIVNGHRSITPKVAIKLAKAFGGTAQSWLNSQSKYDLYQAGLIYNPNDVNILNV